MPASSTSRRASISKATIGSAAAAGQARGDRSSERVGRREAEATACGAKGVDDARIQLDAFGLLPPVQREPALAGKSDPFDTGPGRRDPACRDKPVGLPHERIEPAERRRVDHLNEYGGSPSIRRVGAAVTGETGGVVRRIQTGRLQFYAFMLVAAVGVFALALWIFT